MSETLKNILGTIAVVAAFWIIMNIGTAYEQHVRCLNGYTEVCIPEDFQ